MYLNYPSLFLPFYIFLNKNLNLKNPKYNKLTRKLFRIGMHESESIAFKYIHASIIGNKKCRTPTLRLQGQYVTGCTRINLVTGRYTAVRRYGVDGIVGVVRVIGRGGVEISSTTNIFLYNYEY